MQYSENRQNVKGASLLRKIRILSRFENVGIAAPYKLNGSPHSAALKCEDPSGPATRFSKWGGPKHNLF